MILTNTDNCNTCLTKGVTNPLTSEATRHEHNLFYRALPLLQRLAWRHAHRFSLSTKDFAQQLGCTQRSALRVLRQYEQRGYLTMYEQGWKWHISWDVKQANHLITTTNTKEKKNPYFKINILRRKAREHNIHLAIRAGITSEATLWGIAHGKMKWVGGKILAGPDLRAHIQDHKKGEGGRFTGFLRALEAKIRGRSAQEQCQIDRMRLDEERLPEVMVKVISQLQAQFKTIPAYKMGRIEPQILERIRSSLRLGPIHHLEAYVKRVGALYCERFRLKNIPLSNKQVA